MSKQAAVSAIHEYFGREKSYNSIAIFTFYIT